MTEERIRTQRRSIERKPIKESINDNGNTETDGRDMMVTQTETSIRRPAYGNGRKDHLVLLHKRLAHMQNANKLDNRNIEQ